MSKKSTKNGNGQLNFEIRKKKLKLIKNKKIKNIIKKIINNGKEK